MAKEPTIQDVLDVLQAHSSETDARFNGIESRFEKIDKKFEEIDKRFDKIEKTMVTKDYLDERIADLRGDLASETYRQVRKHEVRYHSA